jgi:hypothetical protein
MMVARKRITPAPSSISFLVATDNWIGEDALTRLLELLDPETLRAISKTCKEMRFRIKIDEFLCCSDNNASVVFSRSLGGMNPLASRTVSTPGGRVGAWASKELLFYATPQSLYVRNVPLNSAFVSIYNASAHGSTTVFAAGWADTAWLGIGLRLMKMTLEVAETSARPATSSWFDNVIAPGPKPVYHANQFGLFCKSDNDLFRFNERSSEWMFLLKISRKNDRFSLSETASNVSPTGDLVFLGCDNDQGFYCSWTFEADIKRRQSQRSFSNSNRFLVYNECYSMCNKESLAVLPEDVLLSAGGVCGDDDDDLRDETNFGDVNWLTENSNNGRCTPSSIHQVNPAMTYHYRVTKRLVPPGVSIAAAVVAAKAKKAKKAKSAIQESTP